MTIWRICIACWMPTATDKHTLRICHTNAPLCYVLCTLPLLSIFRVQVQKCTQDVPFLSLWRNSPPPPKKTLAINISILNIKCIFRPYNLFSGKCTVNSAEDANKNTQQLFVYLSNVKFHAHQFSCSRAV